MGMSAERAPDGGLLLPWLTERQAEALVAIQRYVNEYRMYPTARELAGLLPTDSGTPVSQQRARALIETLIKKGYATKTRGHRTLRLTEMAMEKLQRDAERLRQESLAKAPALAAARVPRSGRSNSRGARSN